MNQLKAGVNISFLHRWRTKFEATLKCLQIIFTVMEIREVHHSFIGSKRQHRIVVLQLIFMVKHAFSFRFFNVYQKVEFRATQKLRTEATALYLCFTTCQWQSIEPEPWNKFVLQSLFPHTNLHCRLFSVLKTERKKACTEFTIEKLNAPFRECLRHHLTELPKKMLWTHELVCNWFFTPAKQRTLKAPAEQTWHRIMITTTHKILLHPNQRITCAIRSSAALFIARPRHHKINWHVTFYDITQGNANTACLCKYVHFPARFKYFVILSNHFYFFPYQCPE